MQRKINLIPVIPVRSGPSSKDEMVSQIIFGEEFSVLNSRGDWSYIELADDNYCGWISNSMINPDRDDQFINLTETVQNRIIAGNPVLRVLGVTDNFPIFIPAGSSLYNFDQDSNSFIVGRHIYNCVDQPLFYANQPEKKELVSIAIQFLGAPYQWGGKTIFGIDCSGLTQTIFKIAGIYLPRDSNQQADKGKIVTSIDYSEPGDLAFFADDKGNIVHTGIIFEKGKIVHASGIVRIDTIDQIGIFNEDEMRYTHNLSGIRRIIES